MLLSELLAVQQEDPFDPGADGLGVERQRPDPADLHPVVPGGALIGQAAAQQQGADAEPAGGRGGAHRAEPGRAGRPVRGEAEQRAVLGQRQVAAGLVPPDGVGDLPGPALAEGGQREADERVVPAWVCVWLARRLR